MTDEVSPEGFLYPFAFYLIHRKRSPFPKGKALN